MNFRIHPTVILLFIVQLPILYCHRYIGGVVQYFPQMGASQVAHYTFVMENAYNYKHIIEMAKERNVDIIVFPELGLTGFDDWERMIKPLNTLSSNKSFSRSPILLSHIIDGFASKYTHVSTVIPSPEEEIILCNSEFRNHKPLNVISCAARDNKMYVVVNHLEKIYTEDVQNYTAIKLFSTNVVFDREGKIVSKYRRRHVLESGFVLDSSNSTELVTFHTDFNVTFILSLGDDFHFLYDQELETKNISDIVVPTNTFLKLPCINNGQSWQVETKKMGVYLLVGGRNCDGGPGIYAGKHGSPNNYEYEEKSVLLVTEIGDLNYADSDRTFPLPDYSIDCFPPPGLLKVLRDVSRVKRAPEIFKEWPVKELIEKKQFQSKEISLNKLYSDHRLCFNDTYCCDYKIRTNKNIINSNKEFKYRYRAVLLVEIDVDEETEVIERTCAIVMCSDDQESSCNGNVDLKLLYTTPTFEYLSVQYSLRIGSYKPLVKKFVSHRFMDFTDFYEVNENNKGLGIQTLQPLADLIIFGLEVTETIKREKSETSLYYTLLIIFIVLVILIVAVSILYCCCKQCMISWDLANEIHDAQEELELAELHRALPQVAPAQQNFELAEFGRPPRVLPDQQDFALVEFGRPFPRVLPDQEDFALVEFGRPHPRVLPSQQDFERAGLRRLEDEPPPIPPLPAQHQIPRGERGRPQVEPPPIPPLPAQHQIQHGGRRRPQGGHPRGPAIPAQQRAGRRRPQVQPPRGPLPDILQDVDRESHM